MCLKMGQGEGRGRGVCRVQVSDEQHAILVAFTSKRFLVALAASTGVLPGKDSDPGTSLSQQPLPFPVCLSSSESIQEFFQTYFFYELVFTIT